MSLTTKRWRIRPATPDDASELARLRHDFRAERRSPTEPRAEFLERCSRWMRQRLRPDAEWRCWLAVSEDQIVGTLWLQLIEKIPNPGDEAELHGYISSVYVVPALRRIGVGAGLLRACLAECDALGTDAEFLWSTSDSRGLYQRHGFAARDDLLERREPHSSMGSSP